MKETVISKNSLRFVQNKNGAYACLDLLEIPSRFNNAYSESYIGTIIDEHLDRILRTCEIRTDVKTTIKPERQEGGQSLLLRIIDDLKMKISKLNPFEQFLFWFSHYWWDCYPPVQENIRITAGSSVCNIANLLVRDFLLPILPSKIKDAVGSANYAVATANHGHYAVMFVNNELKKRFIITDTQLIELRGVLGHPWLGILLDGMPVVNAVCNNGKSRAFFDGIRLMKRKNGFHFEMTISGGYKVDSSTYCIINGMLFERIDIYDGIACADDSSITKIFTRQDKVKLLKNNRESAKQIRAEKSNVYLNDNRLTPIGRYLPSKVTLLESGFSLYGWSDYKME